MWQNRAQSSSDLSSDKTLQKLNALEQTNQEIFELTGAILPRFRISEKTEPQQPANAPRPAKPLPLIPKKPEDLKVGSSSNARRSLPPIPGPKPILQLGRALPAVPNNKSKAGPPVPIKPTQQRRTTIVLPRFNLDQNDETLNVTVRRCARCRETLDSSGGLTTGDKSLHVRCFRCFNCKQSLEHLDFYALPHERDMVEVCFDCYATTLPVCHSCQSSIITRQYIKALGHTYHVEHFRCAYCSKVLEVVDGLAAYVERDGLPWHKDCWQPVVRDKCRKCAQALDDQDQDIIQFGKSQFHEQCFRCAHCKETLQDSLYWSDEQEGICQACKSIQVKQQLDYS